jgi:hypothetical protein
LASRNCTSSARVGASPARAGTTTAHTRSPRARSGIGTIAAFCTFGCSSSRLSISFALSFSPPRTMMSFTRPVIVK